MSTPRKAETPLSFGADMSPFTRELAVGLILQEELLERQEKAANVRARLVRDMTEREQRRDEIRRAYYAASAQARLAMEAQATLGRYLGTVQDRAMFELATAVRDAADAIARRYAIQGELMDSGRDEADIEAVLAPEVRSDSLADAVDGLTGQTMLDALRWLNGPALAEAVDLIRDEAGSRVGMPDRPMVVSVRGPATFTLQQGA